MVGTGERAPRASGSLSERQDPQRLGWCVDRRRPGLCHGNRQYSLGAISGWRPTPGCFLLRRGHAAQQRREVFDRDCVDILDGGRQFGPEPLIDPSVGQPIESGAGPAISTAACSSAPSSHTRTSLPRYGGSRADRHVRDPILLREPTSQGQGARLVDRDLGRASGEGRDLLHERARCRHPEMCPQRVSVGPVLDKYQPQRIFTITVDGVRQAPRFLPGAPHVGNAERKDVVNAFRPNLNAARDNKHG